MATTCAARRERIRAATDPARQRELAAARPPYLPRAADLRPVLLLVRSPVGLVQTLQLQFS